MEAEYRRDTHHSYLVLHDETENQTGESFQKRMFLENSVPGFLSCRMYDIDCSGRYFFDISSRQSLVTMLETRQVDRKILETLLTSILRALNGLQSFLLDAGGFCLKAEWIFSDPACSEFQFCYFPGGGFSWKDQLQKLAEYLLPRLEHKNRDAVRLGYDFYQSVMEERITASDLEALLTAGREEEQQERGGPEREPVFLPDSGRDTGSGREQAVPASREELLNSFFEGEEEREKTERKISPETASVLKLILPLGAGAAVTFLLWYFRYDLGAIAAAAATAAAVVILQLLGWKKEKEAERDTTMEQYVQVQDWLEEEREEERIQEEQNREEQKEQQDDYEDGATCLLTSEAAYRRLAKGYLVPEVPGEISAIAIDQEVTMIGKSSQMDVVLKGIGISRIHARILCRGEDCLLTDLNSRNGTRVNGTLLKPEEEYALKDGDSIQFAGTGFEWRCYRLES